MSRVKLQRDQQKRFLNRIAKYFDFDWSKIAKISNISDRALRDWRREKYNMSYDALLKLHKISSISVPRIVEILPEYWSAKKFARKGGLRRYQIYGNFATPEGRKKGGINSQRLFRLHPAYAKRLGIKIRKAIRKPKPSEELAEFVGMMLGDGGISNYQINLTFNAQTDNEYTGYVQKLIKKLFSISASITLRPLDNTNRVVASSRNLVKFLESKGLKKTNKIKKIPQWILDNKSYSIACLRGLVDTDGSFYSYRHKVFDKIYCNFAMCFTNYSKPLLNTVYKILKYLNFNPIVDLEHVYLHKRKEIDRYFREIGTHNPKHLQKYKNYIAIRNS